MSACMNKAKYFVLAHMHLNFNLFRVPRQTKECVKTHLFMARHTSKRNLPIGRLEPNVSF